MILIESVLGNARTAEWEARLRGAAIDWLELDQWAAQKNRFRTRTAGGVEIAVALDRNTHLQDGDILLWDAAAARAVVVRIELREVMVINLGSLLAGPPDELLRTGLELGHALGNQHWPAVVRETRVYVPLVLDRAVMTSVMKTHDFPGITYQFVPGAAVIPYLAPHEARRLFGGADPAGHLHAPPEVPHGHD